MTSEEFKSKIQEALQLFLKGNLTKNSLNLFEKLGYVTERRAPLHKPTFAEFKDTYIIDHKFDEAKAKAKDWLYVDLLFQLSKEEVSRQANLFDTKQVDKTIIETYLFFIVELNGDEYNRTDLSSITREINRLFPMPVMVLFKYGNKLTFSVINRRLNKRNESKDVLEKVTLIKDISIESPLRAHIEILFDLSFGELLSKHQFLNFVDLHNAWQKTLDTKELNKRFYSELFNWYLWAVQSVRFPNDVGDEKDNDVYNSESVIRLLTRLIFVWFIKEKNLVPQSLFNIKKLKNILNDFQPQSERTSTFYRAILQNLFFATLNTPMDKDITEENKDEKRRFINKQPKTSNEEYLDQTKYRYKDYFINPDKALEIFATIPFLNGGLFECLDYKEGNKEIRFDGFSSTDKRQAFVSDKLFFAEEFVLDLNAEYGTKGKRYKVKGIINILDSYKFTITENTLLEEEVALDPELLGKVFENLLASYNPETQTTARKQTGSFYTPREIVNYMVDESLIAYFKEKFDKADDIEIRLRDLFSHTIDLPAFTKSENTALIEAISEVKVLDPACGSGAFPMGVLHRLVDLLNKLDPANKFWNELQKKRAIAETTEVFNSGDTEERKIRLNEINKAFDLSMNYPDYARKLFLIENCIYGIDIQQIAIQISKLRFFISLIVDQKVNDNKPNRNILSMPNLETKFVAANTLIALDKPQQMTLMAGDVERLEKELASIRHKIFFTRKYSAKKALKKQEKEKREELQTALTQSGYSKNIAGQIAGWNPFDPMQSAKFFDPETMFGFGGGFDVVIGNPPYIDSEVMTRTFPGLREILCSLYKTAKGNWDIYIIFYERGLEFLRKSGRLCYITPNKWLSIGYGKTLREYVRDKIFKICNCSQINVFEAGNNPVIIFLQGDSCTKNLLLDEFNTEYQTISLVSADRTNLENEDWGFFLSKHIKSLLRIRENSNHFGSILKTENPFTTGEAYELIPLINDGTHDKNTFKFVNTGTIDPYISLWGISNTTYLKSKYRYPVIKKNEFKSAFPRRFLQMNNPKLILSGIRYFEVFFDEGGEFIVGKSAMFIRNFDKKIKPKAIMAIFNSKFISWYINESFGVLGIDGGVNFSTDLVDTLPMPNGFFRSQEALIKIVDKIIMEKQNNPNSDTTKLEKLIDEMVYKLYNLTEKEIKIIVDNE